MEPAHPHVAPDALSLVAVAEWLRDETEEALLGGFSSRLAREHEIARLLGEALGHLGSFVRGGRGRLYFMQHSTGRSIPISVRAGSPFVMFVLGLLDLSPVRWVMRAITLAVARADMGTPSGAHSEEKDR